MAAPKHLTAIVCRNHEQFRAWCYDNDRNPHDPSLRPILDERHARGRFFDDVILVDGSPFLMTMVETRIRRKAST